MESQPRKSMSLSRVLIVAVVAQQSTGAQAPAPTAIPNEPTCPTCTINVRNVVTLGTDDGIGSLYGKPMSVNVDSKGRYWMFQELEPPTTFNPNGTVDRIVGRKGSGPGEFRSANNGLVIGDSMLVFDWMESRATMLGPDLKTVRIIRHHYSLNEPQIIEWPRLLIARAYIESSNPPNSTLHRVSLAGSDMQLLGSFGPRGTGGSMGQVEVGQHIARSRNGIWSAYWNRPQFMQWDRNGVMRTSLSRRFDWYTGESIPTLGTQNAPPTARTGLIHEDAEGLVWLFIHKPAPSWKGGWASATPTRYPGGGTEYRTRDMAYDKLFDTYVEVIDPTRARVVTGRTITGYIFQALPGNRAAMYKVDGNGIPRVQIVSLSLVGR
jgi:hypothetical protein